MPLKVLDIEKNNEKQLGGEAGIISEECMEDNNSTEWNSSQCQLTTRTQRQSSDQMLPVRRVSEVRCSPEEEYFSLSCLALKVRMNEHLKQINLQEQMLLQQQQFMQMSDGETIRNVQQRNESFEIFN